MRVSIVIPALNEAPRLQKTLAPLQGLRASGEHQIILVDGGSTDATLEIAAPMVDKIVRATRGRANQMIKGSDVADGDILWFLHADTVALENSFASLLDAVSEPQKLTRSALFWGRFNVIIDGPEFIFRVIEFMMNQRSRYTAVATGDQGIFVSRALYDLIGGYRLIPLMEDIDISKRLRRQVSPLCLSNTLMTSSRRWKKFGVLRTIVKMWTIRLAYVVGIKPSVLYRWYYPPHVKSWKPES